MAVVNASRTLTCESCGRDTVRLYDGHHCAVCRLGYLSGSAEGISMGLRMIGAMITDAVIYEGLDPNDIRRMVEQTLSSEHVREHSGPGSGPVAAIREERWGHEKLLAAEVA